MTKPVDTQQPGLCWYWQILILCLAAGLIISRQPGAILHPQFYGEDGHVWFADAYNLGWFKPLLRTQDGYFQTLPRLAAAFALFWPLRYSPFVMNLVGLLVQLLPVPILLSQRLGRWGTLQFRLALVLAYLVTPNCAEVNVTVTEAQWHLALAACLLILAGAPQTVIGRGFDAAVFLLCGLTGPFCILLLPIAAAFFWLRRNVWRSVPVAILAGTSMLQLHALLFTDSGRHLQFPLGPGLDGLARILSGQVYLATLLGSNMLGSTLSTPAVAVVAVVGTAFVGYFVVRSRAEFRLFLLFSVLLLLAALVSPQVKPQYTYVTAWQVLAAAPNVHYWFFPVLACYWGVTCLLLGPCRTKLSQAIVTVMIPVMLIGLVLDWRHPSYADVHFEEHAALLVNAKKGEAVTIPETPPGWTMRLIKR